MSDDRPQIADEVFNDILDRTPSTVLDEARRLRRAKVLIGMGALGALPLSVGVDMGREEPQPIATKEITADEYLEKFGGPLPKNFAKAKGDGRGSKPCGCGRPISANATQCARCAGIVA